ncbi:enoyl-CoA hydratase/isomerase family protein [Nocardia sp. NPDC059239]|uniref:enoyl-CoA hydratase/isomerase family protein n=1 Tax=unclassified Nocardia TaxID=2637762 RepID=UPI0036C1E5B0
MTTASANTVIVDRSDPRAAIVRLNRPRSLNALNEPMLTALENALSAVERADDVSAVVLAGYGRAFCAGNDLHEIGVDAMSRVRRMHALMLRLQEFPKIVVAAISGYALGGGLEIAMACTFRTAESGALLGLPEIKLNLIPGFGGTQLLPRLVGEQRALDMLLSGEPVDASTALTMGLVDSVSVSDPIDAALRLLARFPAVDSPAQQAIRAAVRRGARLDLAEALDIERDLVRGISIGEAGRQSVEHFRKRDRP